MAPDDKTYRPIYHPVDYVNAEIIPNVGGDLMDLPKVRKRVREAAKLAIKTHPTRLKHHNSRQHQQLTRKLKNHNSLQAQNSRRNKHQQSETPCTSPTVISTTPSQLSAEGSPQVSLPIGSRIEQQMSTAAPADTAKLSESRNL